tara:strand:- start:317 stop:703 length:387 start_codon:yes stop_codon:yes gene_type:complete
MKEKLNKIIYRVFGFLFFICTALTIFHAEVVQASESDQSALIKKVSNSYTKKFCNAIGFGLSKESAMDFSIEENKQAFKKKKEINNIDKELLAEQIAESVIEKCGYPINLSGEKGINIFKLYYLSKDQ